MSTTWSDVGIRFRRSSNPRGDSKERCPKCGDPNSLSVNRIKETWKCWSSSCRWEGGLKNNQLVKVEYRKPPTPSSLDLSPRGLDFLTKRGLSPEALYKHKIFSKVAAFRTDYTSEPICEYEAICIPVYKHKTMVNTIHRRIWYSKPELVDAKLQKRAKWFFLTGCEQPLLNVDNIDFNQPIYWVEGPLDGLALETIGITNWVSLPNGSPLPGNSAEGRLSILDEWMMELDKCPTHHLDLDNDEPGQYMIENLARRLRQEKCRILEWPTYNFGIEPEIKKLKDVGDILEHCGPNILSEFITDSSVPFPLPGCATKAKLKRILMNEPPVRPDAKIGIPEIDNLFSLQLGYLHIFTGIPGTGKALAIDTPIPTPDGWKPMGDLEVGDKVFDEKGHICNVTMVTPVMHDRECFEMKFSDNTSMVCDADHQWFTRDDKARRSEYRAKLNGRESGGPAKANGVDQSYKRKLAGIKTTKEIAQQITVEAGKRYNHSVPMALPLDLPEISLPIDPYVLGAWLGDGHSAGARITKPDEQLFTEIAKAGFTIRDGSKLETKGIGGLHTVLRSMNLLNNKHIPAQYLRASYNQRLRLLQGLMDTDGYIDDRDGKCEFCSIRRELAYQVKELAMSLGLKTNLYEGRAILNGKDCGPKYRVYFTPTIPVFLLERKAKKVRLERKPAQEWRQIVGCIPVQSVPVRCIQVDSPSSLYLAGENFIPTHNSTTLSDFLRRVSECYKWRHLIFSAEDSAKSFYHRVMTQFIGAPYSEMGDEVKDTASDWAIDYFSWIEHDQIKTLDEVLNLAEGLIRQKDIKCLLIDPWNKVQNERVALGMSEPEYLTYGLNKVSAFVKKWMIAGVVVIHPSQLKGRNGEVRAVASYYDINGGAASANIADAIGSIDPLPDQRAPGLGCLPTKFSIHKMRERPALGNIGSVQLIFDPRTKRIMSTEDFNTMRYNYVKGDKQYEEEVGEV